MKAFDFFKKLNELGYTFTARPDEKCLHYEVTPSTNTDRKYSAFTPFKEIESGRYDLEADLEDTFDTFIEWIEEDEGEL